MKKEYQYTSSKIPIIISVLVIILYTAFILALFFKYVISIHDFFQYQNTLFFLSKLFISISYFWGISQAFINAYNISKLDPNAELEINNGKRYLLYSNIIDGVKKEVKVYFENINLLKYNKAKFINLSFYEIFYVENEVKKEIVVSIALTTNLEKKIDKSIEFIKVEKVFFDEFPKTSY